MRLYLDWICSKTHWKIKKKVLLMLIWRHSLNSESRRPVEGASEIWKVVECSIRLEENLTFCTKELTRSILNMQDSEIFFLFQICKTFGSHCIAIFIPIHSLESGVEYTPAFRPRGRRSNTDSVLAVYIRVSVHVFVCLFVCFLCVKIALIHNEHLLFKKNETKQKPPPPKRQ